MNCLAFILPGLVFFQIGTAWYGTELLAPMHLNRLLGLFGGGGIYLPAVLIVAVLLGQHIAAKDSWAIQPGVLAAMAGESCLWAVPLVVMANFATGVLLAAQSQPAGTVEAIIAKALPAVGAGIYEEFIFRMVAVAAAMLVFVDLAGLKKHRSWVVLGALLVGSAGFSLYHLSGDQLAGNVAFPWGAFIFRAAAGMYLGAIYIIRGFGLCVGCHAAFNLYVAFGAE